mmetsp:Transcript_6794/g.7469  ORF Transcript_6794/g.7469 Transcript_6794/m.7469 type:complete len:750 (-) Transcript_6794:222-2471(-)
MKLSTMKPLTMQRRTKFRIFSILLASVTGCILLSDFSISVSNNFLRRRVETKEAQVQVQPDDASLDIKDAEERFLKQNEVMNQDTAALYQHKSISQRDTVRLNELKNKETKFQQANEVLNNDLSQKKFDASLKEHQNNLSDLSENYVAKLEKESEQIPLPSSQGREFPAEAMKHTTPTKTLDETPQDNTVVVTEEDETPEEIATYEIEKKNFHKANVKWQERQEKELKEKEEKESKEKASEEKVSAEKATEENVSEEKETKEKEPSKPQEPIVPQHVTGNIFDDMPKEKEETPKLLVFGDENETIVQATKFAAQEEQNIGQSSPNLLQEKSKIVISEPSNSQSVTVTEEEAPKLPVFGDEKETIVQASKLAEQEEQNVGQSSPKLLQEKSAIAISEPSTSQSVRVTEEPLDEESLMLKELRTEMCSDASNIHPVHYGDCDPEEIINIIPLFGGMCNALKFVILGAIQSAEENRCFAVDESKSPLNYQNKDGEKEGFINKFFEPMGLDMTDERVVSAQAANKTEFRTWDQFWVDEERRRVYGRHYTIPKLGYTDLDGHQIKRDMLRRMWRLIPKVRKDTCNSLDQYNLGDEYMSFSVRRGDKTLEKFAYTELSEYITEAENNLYRYPNYMKNLVVPKIFVATDDCTVLPEFRKMRPDWTFLSECDKEKKSDVDTGFALSDVHNWGRDEQAAHFGKFFVEIYALTGAKVFIGVAYTNVSWWVYFLRPFRHSFILLDKPKGEKDNVVFDHWR